MDERLKKIYFNKKAAKGALASSAKELADATKRKRISLKSAQNFLNSIDSYTKHRRVIHKVNKRRKIISHGIHDLMSVDIMEIARYYRANKGYRYILVAVLVFSKKLFIRFMKKKSAYEVTRAFKEILKKSGPIKRLHSDEDTAMMSGEFQALLEKHSIRHQYSNTDFSKAANAEVYIREIHRWIERYRSAHGTNKFYHWLPLKVRQYNNSPHRSTGVAPNKVTYSNESKIFEKLNPELFEPRKKIEFKFNVGDYVKFVQKPSYFRHQYYGTTSKGVHRIIARYAFDPPVYQLKDVANDAVLAQTFYASQLIPVSYKE